MLQSCGQDLDFEQTYDANSRAAHGAQWTIMASPGLNQPYRQNIEVYKTKIAQAAQQDELTTKKFEDTKAHIQILAMTKAELLNQMPVSEASQEIAQRPESLALKQALDIISASKTKKDEIIQGCVSSLANLNMIDDLMKVHQKETTKDAVF